MALRDEFQQLLVRNYEEARDKLGYDATKFIRMISPDRGVEVARMLIESGNPSRGFLRLWNEGKNPRLDLSVEAAVVDNPRFHSLFDEKIIKKAKVRLRGCGYRFKN